MTRGPGIASDCGLEAGPGCRRGDRRVRLRRPGLCGRVTCGGGASRGKVGGWRGTLRVFSGGGCCLLPGASGELRSTTG